MTDVLWQAFSDVIIPTLLTAAGAAIVGVLLRLFKRYGLELDAETQAKLEKIIQDILLRVEEIARAKAKSGVHMTSELKQLKAVALAEAEGIHPETAKKLIGQELPKMRTALGQD